MIVRGLDSGLRQNDGVGLQEFVALMKRSGV